MANWNIPATLFMTIEEIEEALEFGFLNYDKEGATTTDGAFGYKNKYNSLPALFYGGGEDNDRANHQPMYNQDMMYSWTNHEAELKASKPWSERRKDYELKPCPFCRLDVHEIERSSSQYRVVCDAHKGGCGASTGYESSKQSAIKAWNRRHG